jgi:hypothetical protein
MRTLSLDFERKRRSARAGYGLVAAGGLALALVLGAQSMIDEKMERYDQPSRRATERHGKRLLPSGAASEAEAIEGARVVVSHLTGPWAALFKTLEAVEENDVVLLALRPDIQSRKIRIYAEAKSFGSMVSYYQALGKSGELGDVVLVEHEIQLNDPQRPVRFSMTAAWGIDNK